MNDQIDPKQHRVDRLRQSGLKVTASRIAILDALESDRRHPSAEMLLEALAGDHPSLSLSTVYATLETFIKSGLVRRIGGAGGKLRVDGTTQDHDHAICRECGEVFDIKRDVVSRPRAPAELPDGLRVTNLYLEYEVVCSACGGDS